MNRFLILSMISACFLVFSNYSYSETAPQNTEQFKKYWYSGNAEITTYKLEQARYGEIHKGYAVLIFVTEDFSDKKQVKLDDPYSNRGDAVSVLKLNLIKKFNTGMYRYSIMESVFTPIQSETYPDTLKLTSSSQEWCGNVFTQVNLKENKYDVQMFSYFESEGDRKYSLDKTFLEDEIFTRIRLNPASLPVGKINLLPSLIISRLRHQEFSPVMANASLKELNSGEMEYSLNFFEIDRELKIVFNKNFPHEIISWEEVYTSGFGHGSKKLVTKATRKKSLIVDYWNRNSNIDEFLRTKMGIE